MKENDDERLAGLAMATKASSCVLWPCLLGPPSTLQSTHRQHVAIHIRMARSLLFLPTFYNFPREMLCANGPNLQKQFKHQRPLEMASRRGGGSSSLAVPQTLHHGQETRVAFEKKILVSIRCFA